MCARPSRICVRCCGPFFSSADTICTALAPAITAFTASWGVCTPPVTARSSLRWAEWDRQPVQPKEKFGGIRQVQRVAHASSSAMPRCPAGGSGCDDVITWIGDHDQRPPVLNWTLLFDHWTAGSDPNRPSAVQNEAADCGDSGFKLAGVRLVQLYSDAVESKHAEYVPYRDA